MEQDAAGKMVESLVKKDEILMLTVTAGLEAAVSAAQDPEYATEMWIQCQGKKALRGGNDMWDYSVKSGDKFLRGAELPAPSQLPAQLPE